MTLEELCAGEVVVWGLGAEGLAMTRLLLSRGVTPTLVDDLGPEAEGRVAATFDTEMQVVAPGRVEWRSGVVVRSPGVSRYRPELAAAEAAGVSVTTAMAVWLDDFHDRAVLAVTGTKGKSTTASLAAAILEHQGKSVELAGNIGTPVTDLYDRPLADVTVVEVSSYQAADVTRSPKAAVLTSLAPDHLDWHGGEEAYYRDKLRLVTAGPPGGLAVNAGSPEALLRTADRSDRLLFGPSGRVQASSAGAVTVDGEPLVVAGRLRVPGAHNLSNLCGAIAGVMLVGGTVPGASAVDAAVDAYRGLPSRCRTVGVVGGIEYVDDALASNPFATVASLGAFPGRDLTVILGGADRGTDPSELLAALGSRRPAPQVVVLAGSADRASASLSAPRSAVPAEVAPDMADAVQRAAAITPTGGVVLFSPSAPTPPGQGGYTRRSREFVAAAGLEETETGG
jgi:UDP-N-acetylmuramoylalanine--D-glutamate ligase